MNITFRQLRVFAAVAQHSSVQRAAEVLHLTPQAISMQVREVESQIGLVLFDRTGRRLTLSAAGEHFMLYTQRLLSTLKECQEAMNRFKRVESGLLTIGMVASAKYFLPYLLARFRRDHPGLEVHLELGNREQLIALLAAHEVDMAVMGRAPADWPGPADPFASNPQVLITAASHPLAAQAHVAARDLAREPFIVRERGSGTRAALEEFFRAHQIEPTLLMEIPNDEAIKQAVMAGLGISLASRNTIDLECRSGLLATPSVEGLPLQRQWHLVASDSRTPSPAAEAFRAFLLDQGRAHVEALGLPPGSQPVPRRAAARSRTAPR